MDELTAPREASGIPPRDEAIGRLSLAFLLDQVTTGVGGLKPRDALLVLAVNQANIAPLTRDPAARSRYGAMEAAAPDAERRPVSVSAVAASLGLPFETVRRRLRQLEARGVCAIAAGGVIVPEAYLTSPAYVRSVLAGHLRLWAFYGELKAAGLLDALPASRFPPEPAVPVRAAARLLSDYVLRTLENLMGVVGDAMAALILLGTLAGTLADHRGVANAELARRLTAPQETVRRHALRLVADGACLRTPRGLVVSEAFLTGPAMGALLRDNTANVQRLFAGLSERGVVEAWDRLGPPRT